MSDEKYFAQALAEFRGGTASSELMDKAYVLAKGNALAQEFEYVGLRVEQLKKRASSEKITAAFSPPSIDKWLVFLFRWAGCLFLWYVSYEGLLEVLKLPPRAPLNEEGYTAFAMLLGAPLLAFKVFPGWKIPPNEERP